MTDADVQAQRQRIESLINKWKDLLWLGSWRFRHSFHREKREQDYASGGGGVAAQVVVQWEYLSADFSWYLPVVEDMPDDELDEYVAHEFLHVVVAEMGKGKKDPHEERVVTMLARAFKAMQPAVEAKEVALASAQAD